MRVTLEDTAGTGFEYLLDTDRDVVEVTASDGDLELELTLEQADRWRHGRARIHRASGFAEPLTAHSLAAEDNSEEDIAWLAGCGIAVGE